MPLYYAKPDAYSYYDLPYTYATRPQPAVYSVYDPAYLRAVAEKESMRKFLAEQAQRKQEEEAQRRFEAAMRIAHARAEARQRAQTQGQGQAQGQARFCRPQSIFDGFATPFGRSYVPCQDKVDSEEGGAFPGFMPSRPGAENLRGQHHGQGQNPSTPMYADEATQVGVNDPPNYDDLGLMSQTQVPMTRHESTFSSKPTSQTSGFSIPVTSPGNVPETVTATATAAAAIDSPTPTATLQENNGEQNSLRSSSLAEIASLASRFSALHDNFTMPSSLDFEHEPTAANDVTQVSDERPRLAYTSRSTPVHAYEDQLMRLLQATDSIDSNGDVEVRSARRMLVREIEAALSEIDAEVRRMWDECGQVVKGQEVEMDLANDEKTEMVLDDKSPSVSIEASSIDVEPESTTSTDVEAATEGDSTLDTTSAVHVKADDSANSVPVAIEVDYTALQSSSVGASEAEFSTGVDTTEIPTARPALEFESAIPHASVVVDSAAPLQVKELDINGDRDAAEAAMFDSTTAAELDMKVEDPDPSNRSSSLPLNPMDVEEKGIVVAPQSPRLSVSLPRSSTPRSVSPVSSILTVPTSPSQLSASLKQEEEDSVLPREARSDDGGVDDDAGTSANEEKEETEEDWWYDAMKDGVDMEDKEMVVVDGLASNLSPSLGEGPSPDADFMPSSNAMSDADSVTQGQDNDDKESSSFEADSDADTLSLISNVALPVLAQEAYSTKPTVPAQVHGSEVEYVMI